MGTKNRPGDFDCYANAHPDEPMFVLLGRDPDAPMLVESWASIREYNGEDEGKVREARECADSMRAWLEKLGKAERKPTSLGPGELKVGTTLLEDGSALVSVELPRDLTGYIEFSAAEARAFAGSLVRMARRIDGKE